MLEALDIAPSEIYDFQDIPWVIKDFKCVVLYFRKGSDFPKKGKWGGDSDR